AGARTRPRSPCAKLHLATSYNCVLVVESTSPQGVIGREGRTFLAETLFRRFGDFEPAGQFEAPRSEADSPRARAASSAADCGRGGARRSSPRSRFAPRAAPCRRRSA